MFGIPGKQAVTMTDAAAKQISSLLSVHSNALRRLRCQRPPDKDRGTFLQFQPRPFADTRSSPRKTARHKSRYERNLPYPTSTRTGDKRRDGRILQKASPLCWPKPLQLRQTGPALAVIRKYPLQKPIARSNARFKLGPIWPTKNLPSDRKQFYRISQR